MVTKLVVQPLDNVLKTYGDQLGSLGASKARKVLGRALNYEGARAYTRVKRALRKQTSIPMGMIQRGVRLLKASTAGGGSLELAIIGTGRPLSLKVFSARQFGPGTKATVWGRRQLFPSAFMGPRPGTIAPRLGGHVFVRSGASRKPIEMLYGPGIANELVRDESAQTFYRAGPSILARVGKEIGAVLRGF